MNSFILINTSSGVRWSQVELIRLQLKQNVELSCMTDLVLVEETRNLYLYKTE